MNASSEASALDAAMSDPVPQIKAPSDPLVELYVGVSDTSGDWQRTAVVRELTGDDEEALAAFEAKGGVGYADYMSFLLRRAVESIGNINVKQEPGVIDNLIIGDRDKLFMAIVETTYGTMREYQVDCTTCGQSNDVFVDISTFPEKPLKEGVGPKVSTTLKDGTVVEFRLPNGHDSLESVKVAKTTAEQNTFLLARCVTNVTGNTHIWAKELGMADRAKLIKTLLDAQPGPEIGEVEARCAECNETFAIMLDWASLLLG
jgi:hypothetical protein